MSEEITEDSTGVTEVASQETGESVPETVEAEADNESVDVETESEGAETETEDSALEVYDFGDFQASYEDLVSWKDAHETRKSMNAAHTQRSQKLAAQAKEYEQKMSSVEAKLEQLASIESEIDKLALGDLADIDLDKVLAEEGAEEHLKYQREIDRRKAIKAVISQKIQKAQQAEIVQAQEFLSKMLDWSSEDKQKSDVASINAYVKDVEMPLKDFSKVSSPHVMQAFLEAQKYRELIKQREQTSKKVKKAPKITKPTAVAKPKQLTLAERMYGKR